MARWVGVFLNHETTSVQITAWCRHQTRWWSNHAMHTCNTRPQRVNILRSHFCRRNFLIYFLEWEFFNFKWYLREICPKGPVDNKSTLVRAIAWYLTGANPLPEPILTPVIFGAIWGTGPKWVKELTEITGYIKSMTYLSSWYSFHAYLPTPHYVVLLLIHSAFISSSKRNWLLKDVNCTSQIICSVLFLLGSWLGWTHHHAICYRKPEVPFVNVYCVDSSAFKIYHVTFIVDKYHSSWAVKYDGDME